MAGGLFREYSGYFSHATEVWKQHVIGVTIEAFDEYRDSVCKTLQDTVAQASSRPVPDGQGAVNRHEEMFGEVQSVLENAQHLAQQRIADTLAQTFNSQPPPILLSPLSNQTIQANLPGESAISQGGVISEQNDSSLDVSIKSEVDSSSGSECESDTDDDEEVQVKDEPNEEEEDIILGLDENYNHTDASSHEQTENMDNSGDHRKNSNECAREQAESNEAMAIDGELVAVEANSEQDGPIIIEIQYVSPPSSPSNAEANGSSAGQQQVSISLNEDIASDDVADHLDAEEDGDFGEDEHMDVNNYHRNLENNESDLDGQHESDREGAIIDEETDGEDCDSSEEQENMSEVEDNEQEDSGDETNKDDDDYNETEDEEASLGVAGPSTSAQERQGTRRVAKRQIGSGKASKRQRTGRDVETVPLSVITKKLKCTVPGCKKVVKSKTSMNRHLLSKHQLKEYRCLVRRCHGKVSTSFTTRGQLNDHLDQVHSSTTRWTCRCSKKFKSYNALSALSAHYRQYHELGLFACSKDGCTFKPTRTRIKVQNHQANHRDANYECPVDGCDRSFKKKSHFDDHLVTHSGERPFPCPECDKSFARKYILTAHLLTHSGERLFPCPGCDKSFTQKGTLTRHLRIHRNDKCFRCTWPQCTYTASDSSTGIKHIRTEHFKLPRTKKQQLAAGIVDDRDARDYLAKN